MAGLDQLRAKLGARWFQAAPRHARWIAAVLGLTIACDDAPAGETRQPASTAAAGEGGSPVSLDSALALFRRDLTPATELQSGERSIERVIGRLLKSVARSDTNDLRALVMTRREFAYLYYPTSPFARSPTKQEPALAWFLHLQQSQKGVTRLLNRYAGKPVRVIRNDCKAPPRVEGINVLWDDCVQMLLQGRDTVRMRLFSGVYERNGRFKILSYGNDL